MEIFYFFPILPFTSFLIFTVVLLTDLPFSSGGHGNWFDSCANTFSCGNITGVGYPFSGNDRPRECGFPGLELDCNKFDESTTTISIMKVRYRVLEINQTANILTITREDFAAEICEAQSFNATLDPALFDFASRYVNFTYKFSCPPSVRPLPGLESMPPVPEGFDCLVSGFNLGNGYVQIGGPGGAGTTCEASVVIPVRNSTVVAGEDGNDFLNLKEILEEGFDVKWKVDDELCRECENSGGRCGFDLKGNRFSCWCPEQSLPSINTCMTNTGGSTSLQLSPATSIASGMRQYLLRWIKLKYDFHL
nr:LEAF RUST 10 DISEASE-RESISTANCE LOCUS RECEPTOR-LIKE PROTEIN KINASE-like 1.4 isoform X1 [Ipomoea batatas]